MDNYLTVILAAVAHLGALTKDEYTALCKKLRNTTLPAGEDAAWRFMEDIFKELDIEKLSSKLSPSKPKLK